VTLLRSESAPLLEVRDLKTYFRSPLGLVRAVDGVSFTLQRGMTLGVVGESGSGKTVLSRSVMNILPRNAALRAGGEVLFRGEDLRKLSNEALRALWGPGIALIFQDPMTALNPVLTIGRQLMEPLRYHLRMSRGDARVQALALLKEVGIPAPEQRIDEYPHQLSGGMRQRVIIAIALSCGPSLMIADEPTTALDVTVQKQILDLLAREQASRDMGMILVTHDLGVVANRTDHIAVMYAGRIVEHAPTKVLFKNMRHPYSEALMQSIPRIEYPSHTRLLTIPGRPPSLVDPPQGCRFAPRCRYAQPRCIEEDPSILIAEGTRAEAFIADHSFACFFPVGTDAGRDALSRNIRTGRSATGAPVEVVKLPHLKESG
jgi:peptide/nickel transport system ATP-binding protein